MCNRLQHAYALLHVSELRALCPCPILDGFRRKERDRSFSANLRVYAREVPPPGVLVFSEVVGSSMEDLAYFVLSLEASNHPRVLELNSTESCGPARGLSHAC